LANTENRSLIHRQQHDQQFPNSRSISSYEHCEQFNRGGEVGDFESGAMVAANGAPCVREVDA
jgi:hypothetical protein